MDSSRRAVESYWRSRMIDAATSDEDKVTPVYKLEEICEVLRSSHVSIVKEFSEFILKRLEHKSPIVKQKALRLIKYAVGKSGVEFRREMQRHSVAVRQLFHYKGQPDPLKGDALNKAVRETAHDAISAIFAEEDNKPAPSENLNRRIQGFGNSNYEPPPEDKKSFLSEVVGLGSASIKQGLSNFAQGHSSRKNGTSSPRGPNLQRSLTTEIAYDNRYEPVEYGRETLGTSKSTTSGTWNQDSRVSNGNSSSGSSVSKTREERLLETIATAGGVRLQPTRDAIQAFLVEAAKLDALVLSHALETKLKSPSWQVRFKALCILESIVRRSGDEHFSIVTSYFSENQDAVIGCSESPQASLRDKASKVMPLLDGGKGVPPMNDSEKSLPSNTSSTIQMPDLLDTSDAGDYGGTDKSLEVENLSSVPLVDDLFGGGLNTVTSTSELKNDDDPFSDVLFHTTETRENPDDLFSGMNFENDQVTDENKKPTSEQKNEPGVFDIFGSSSEPAVQEHARKDVIDLMSGLSIHEDALKNKDKGDSKDSLSESLFSVSSQPNHQNQVPHDSLTGTYSSPMVGTNMNATFFPGMPYLPSGMMFNPAFSSQPMGYAPTGNFFTQQQLLSAMSNYQQFGNPNLQSSGGGYSSPLPDIFQPNLAAQSPSSVMNSSKKEDTRAFDFISDHVAAARDPKRVV
ncbi:VHS domain-containing protein At3g16270-like [Cucurbita pepo subsp. pepo]|uniref:VHS domain-containing protein At3g16270-like n=1 Tax=Cucurbita pepo subsp. pepo TaxID=3664 RepID=UPI000C9D9207|nr:VHS domain-containing protein At3g16270-like [Cucurbita pepo subsp. pepo]